MKKYSGSNIFNDPSRPSYQKRVDPLNNVSKLGRFETDISLNGRTIFEDKNNMINSLNEEIISLKKKMRFVYDKDKEIQELTIKNTTLEKEVKEYQSYESENIRLMKENKDYQEKITELYRISSELANEKNTLEQTNERLMNELSEVDTTETTETSEDVTESKEVKESRDVTESKDKPIQTAIDDLRNIIQTKLVTIQESKLNDIFTILQITNTTDITRELIQSILKLI